MKSPGQRILKDDCGCFLAANGVYKCNTHRAPEADRLAVFDSLLEDLATCLHCFGSQMQPAFRRRVENNLRMVATRTALKPVA